MAESGYSQSQILTMQQDAVRRVHEMQRRARTITGNEPVELSNAQEAVPTSAILEKPDNPLPFRAGSGLKSTAVATSKLSDSSNHATSHVSSGHSVSSPLAGLLSQGGIESFLDRLGIDNERLLLIGIILLLLNEGADNMLLLALAYILL